MDEHAKFGRAIPRRTAASHRCAGERGAEPATAMRPRRGKEAASQSLSAENTARST